MVIVPFHIKNIQMKIFKISALAKKFGLSRSTLLYYDRIGLLPPSGRSRAGYRCYSEKDVRQLERICNFKEAGLTLKEVQKALSSGDEPSAALLENRLGEITQQIRELRNKQRLLTGMLKQVSSGELSPSVDKKMWVEILQAAGMDDAAMTSWHVEFEKKAPESHHEFLLSLDIPANEVIRIREWAAGIISKQKETQGETA